MSLTATGPATTGRPCTCFVLRRLARTVSRLYDQHLASVGLRTTQFSLLRWAAHEALPVAALAARMGLERTTLSRNLRPLADAGYLTLRPGEDARQRVVSITPAGQALLRRARSAWHAAQAQVESTLGAEGVQHLHGVLDDAYAELSPLVEETGNDDE